MAVNTVPQAQTPSGDMAAKAYSANVNQTKRAAHVTRSAPAAAPAAPEAKERENVPSQYTLLLSRVERRLERGRLEREALEPLIRLLTQRLEQLSEQARRRIASLPELQAAGLADVSTLPDQVRTRLLDSAQAAATLELLKQPVIAALMKHQPPPAAL